MGEVLGIIPAGGQGGRWGGYYKEFLPIRLGEWFLDRVAKSMFIGGAKEIIVISSVAKIAAHSHHLSNIFDTILYKIINESDRDKDWYYGIKVALPHSKEINYFAMPDTYFPLNSFMRWLSPSMGEKDFYFGLFDTDTPERFGIILNNKVIDKPKDLSPGIYPAWGVLIWKKKVSDFWLERKPETFEEALNLAIKHFDWTTFKLDFYYDMASWKDYKEFIHGIKT